jgi:hypothetical protein
MAARFYLFSQFGLVDPYSTYRRCYSPDTLAAAKCAGAFLIHLLTYTTADCTGLRVTGNTLEKLNNGQQV